MFAPLACLLALALPAHAEEDISSKAAEARKYLAKRLEVGPLRITTVTTNQYGGVTSASSVDLWTVYQGQNTIVRGKDFATLMGDAETLTKMKKARGTGLAIGLPMTAVGLGLAGTGYYLYSERPMKNFGWLLGGGVGGGLLATLGVLTATAPSRKETWVKYYYEEEQAEELVDGYNSQMMQDLGITKEDVIEYIKQKGEIQLQVQPFIASNMVGVTGTF